MRPSGPLNILCTWEIGGGYGHLLRLRPVVDELRQSGHRVSLATCDIARTQSVFPDLPCYQAPCHADKGMDYPHAGSLAEILHNIGCGSQQSVFQIAAAWQALFDLVRPDVVVMDFSPTALLAVQGRGVRRVLIDNGYSHPPDTPCMPSLRPWQPGYRDMHEGIERSVLESVNAWLRAQELEPLPYLAALFHRADSINLLTLPELDHTGPKPGAAYRGYFAVGGEPPPWPSTDGKRVFVYLKPFPGLDALLGRLAAMEYSVLAIVPDCGEGLLDKYRDVPRLHLTERMFDIRAIARQADYALSVGGDTVGILLSGGTPVCVLPYHPEQRLTGLRAADTGAALCIETPRGRLPGAAVILDRLGRLIDDPEPVRRAREFAARYRHLRPAGQIAEVVAEIEGGPGQAAIPGHGQPCPGGHR